LPPQKKPNSLRLAGVVKESVVDGPGFRYTVFVQGCPHHCEGCHNPQTHDFDAGFDCTIDRLADSIGQNPLLKGVTFSGGEPMCQAQALAELAERCRQMGLDIICYTGYTFEQLLSGADDKNGWMKLLRQTDILIDGRFVLAERDLTLKFRGSKNQRILDVARSLSAGYAVEAQI
jgi:anaerobic ribonucleoside-triphosphate reductase activating protein